MEEYRFELKAYHSALRTTSGCGKHGQVFIDAAYEKLEKAVQEIPEEELGGKPRKSFLPPKETCSYDGNHGFTTGMGRMGSGRR